MKPYYDHGGITIFHGDCREILPELTADVLFTDPPYGIGFASQPTTGQRRAGMQPEQWDEEAPWFLPILVRRFATSCVWGGNYFSLPPSRGWLAWFKPDAPPSMGSCEFAWTNLDRNAMHITHSIAATNAERVGHPTQKPLRVVSWALESMPEGSVLDPWAGSGTTLRAAKDLGRRAIGIEIEERYCEIAAKRLSQEVLFPARSA